MFLPIFHSKKTQFPLNNNLISFLPFGFPSLFHCDKRFSLHNQQKMVCFVLLRIVYFLRNALHQTCGPIFFNYSSVSMLLYLSNPLQPFTEFSLYKSFGSHSSVNRVRLPFFLRNCVKWVATIARLCVFLSLLTVRSEMIFLIGSIVNNEWKDT